MHKTVLVSWNGYHSVSLDPESCKAAMFITEFGRYQYLSVSMGLAASVDGYTKCMDDITDELPNKVRIVDYTLWGGLQSRQVLIWEARGRIRGVQHD